jgi:arginyl-tRNA synthetase
MKPVIDILEDRISAAMAAATGRSDCAAIVRSATDPKFGDYQANGVMALAKKIKTNPRKLAEEVVKKLDVSDICEGPEIAGPGFINLRLKANFVSDRLLEINAAPENRLGVDKAVQSKTIVVDFSCPNIAKQMHVGHLRSTIIGDCICRMLEFLGHKVIRQNHIGDWGTQFGMLCALFRDKTTAKDIEELKKIEDEWLSDDEILKDIETFYQEAKQKYDSDENFAADARDAIAGLQRGEKYWKSYWQAIVRRSESHYTEIYRKLGVTLTNEDIRGESAYNDDLPVVVDELKKAGLAQESGGAICVFPEGFKNKEGEPLPFMIQKSDGAYLYATTDLAAIRYRINELKADEIIYVTDARQRLHFEMLFATARMAKWVSDDIELSHVMFGSVLGEDGAPLKTRSGENVKLKELLDEAVERATAIVEEKNPDLEKEKKSEIAKAVGIGAVKYADYSNNRTSDYIFSFDKMLAMDGNTAPYMQYAYARIKSIERKAQEKNIEIEKELRAITDLSLTEPAELDLAKTLSRYGEAIQSAAADNRPNYLTAYMYELAQKFSGFYTNCPVLDAGPDKRPTRLLLCDLTAKTIKHGLSELLGIEVVEQM